MAGPEGESHRSDGGAGAAAAAIETPAGPVGIGPLLELAKSEGWRLLILFGSLARGDRDAAGRLRARDADFAVLCAAGASPDLLTQGRWQAALEDAMAPLPVDMVLIHPGLSPVTRFHIFRDGQLIYEAEPGLFGREWDRAFFLYADSEHFRRQQWEALRGGS